MTPSRALPGTIGTDWKSMFAAAGEMAVPLLVLAIVIALITPMPGYLLDLLIVIDIMFSVVVMMVSLYIRRASEFSVFPTTLLLLTLFRLALNVSSSRLILLNGNAGTAAAGDVIEAFGNFVVGGNYIIGAVIFLVLIAIQYVVINHGAVRISEVTARFTLDALPGKQMSIDSDLNAGLIEENEARRRRKQLAAEAEFYGAMDGASRFTQRDAVASILITAINIIAGFLIGVFQHGMELRHALETYTVLTIGDGLVTVIPALMISVSGGLIVTRASSEEGLGAEFRAQVFSSYEPLMLASGVLVALAMFPGLPAIPFLLVGGGLGTVSWRMRKTALAGVKAKDDIKPVAPRDEVESLLRVEPLAVEVGLNLVKLAQGGAESPLLRRISGIRRQMASDLGFLLPPVRIADNLSLAPNEYSVLLKGVEIARFELAPGCLLAIPAGRGGAPPEGRPTRDPAFGVAAWWVPQHKAEAARAAGCTVVDPASVMGTHLAELFRSFAHEVFSRQDARRVLDRAAVDHPKVVEDLVPKLLQLATVQRVLQNLLRERVSIRDAVSILEALGEGGATTRNPVLLTEYVRQSIRRAVAKPYLNRNGDLPAYLMDAALDQRIESAVEHGEQNSMLGLDPASGRDILSRVARQCGGGEGQQVLICGAGGRYFLRQMLEQGLPNVAVLSHNEIPAGVKVLSLGVIE